MISVHQTRQSLNTKKKIQYIFVSGVAGFVIEKEKSNVILLSATDEGEKKEFIQICGKIELRNKIYYKGDLYELPPFYHRTPLLI